VVGWLVVGLALVLSPLPGALASSHGYTWSLLTFVVPGLALLAARFPHLSATVRRAAFVAALACLIPMGIGLNLLFAHAFFAYPNPDATLGWTFPGLVWATGTWSAAIPLEEIAFYATGFTFMLTLYASLRRRAERWAPHVGWTALALVLAAIAALAAARALGGPPAPYALFLLLVPMLWTCGWLIARPPAVDGRAMALTTATIIAQSIVWEPGLALPRGWWAYVPDAMLGIELWPRLPIEAVVVWACAPVTATITYEALQR